MNKKLLELLKTEKVQEEIKGLYCKLDKERFSNSSFQGWIWSIILDEDGEVDYMYNSYGTTRMDVHEGTATVVAILVDNAEVTTDSMGEITEVEDYGKFKEYLAEEFDLHENIDSEDREYDERKTEYIEENANWPNYYEFNADGHRQVENEAWEADCDYYSYDKISDEINELIEQYEGILSYQAFEEKQEEAYREMIEERKAYEEIMKEEY